MTINEWFDHVFVINLDRRTDRWEHVLTQCDLHGLDVERFAGIDMHEYGNDGCTASHGALLKLICDRGYKKTLVLEDDFEFRFTDAQERFGLYINQVPSDWWMLYLGGGYGDERNTRVAPNVVRFNHMKTTSSYGVTLEAARDMHPWLKGIGPIDELYGGWHMRYPCYCFTPRICVQYPNYSDLQRRHMDNRMSMEDRGHEILLGIEHDLGPVEHDTY